MSGAAGFSATLGESGDADRQRRSDNDSVRAAEDEPTVFERPVVERLVARPFRDAAFAAAVKAAYAEEKAAPGSPADIKRAEALWSMLRAFVKVAAEECDETLAGRSAEKQP